MNASQYAHNPENASKTKTGEESPEGVLDSGSLRGGNN